MSQKKTHTLDAPVSSCTTSQIDEERAPPRRYPFLISFDPFLPLFFSPKGYPRIYQHWTGSSNLTRIQVVYADRCMLCCYHQLMGYRGAVSLFSYLCSRPPLATRLLGILHCSARAHRWAVVTSALVHRSNSI